MPSLVRSGVWLLAANLGNAFDSLPQIPDPRATAEPQLEARDVDSMVGIFISNNQYQTMFCNPGRTPVDVSGHVLCSSPGLDPPNATTAVTACSDSYALFGTTSFACTYPTTCGSMRLWYTSGAVSTATWIACGTSLPAEIYRNPPPITSSARVTGTSRSSSSSSSSTTQVSSSTSSTPPQPTPTPQASQAWIAGPVIGGVVGIALIAFLVWWIMRRRRQKQAAASASQNTGIPNAGSPPVMSQWSSPSSAYGTPLNKQFSPTSPGGTLSPYQAQFPHAPPISPPQVSQYPQGPSPVQGSSQMYGVSPPPGQFPPQQAQWQAPVPIHEMPSTNYDGPAELSGNAGPYEAPPSNK